MRGVCSQKVLREFERLSPVRAFAFPRPNAKPPTVRRKLARQKEETLRCMKIIKIVNLIIIVLIISACGQQSNKTNNMSANNIFEEGDVLIFQYPDKTYGITILAEVILFRGHHDYEFCRTTFKSEQKPNITDIEKINVIGYDLPSGLGGTRKVFCAHFAQHNKLKKFADKFEKIGTVQFKDTDKKVGKSRGGNNFESFCEKFTEYDWENNQWSHFTIKEYSLIDFIN